MKILWNSEFRFNNPSYKNLNPPFYPEEQRKEKRGKDGTRGRRKKNEEE